MIESITDGDIDVKQSDVGMNATVGWEPVDPLNILRVKFNRELSVETFAITGNIEKYTLEFVSEEGFEYEPYVS